MSHSPGYNRPDVPSGRLADDARPPPNPVELAVHVSAGGVEHDLAAHVVQHFLVAVLMPALRPGCQGMTITG
jgi:hypothetical protein